MVCPSHSFVTRNYRGKFRTNTFTILSISLLRKEFKKVKKYDIFHQNIERIIYIFVFLDAIASLGQGKKKLRIYQIEISKITPSFCKSNQVKTYSKGFILHHLLQECQIEISKLHHQTGLKVFKSKYSGRLQFNIWGNIVKFLPPFSFCSQLF